MLLVFFIVTYTSTICMVNTMAICWPQFVIWITILEVWWSWNWRRWYHLRSEREKQRKGLISIYQTSQHQQMWRSLCAKKSEKERKRRKWTKNDCSNTSTTISKNSDKYCFILLFGVFGEYVNEINNKILNELE